MTLLLVRIYRWFLSPAIHLLVGPGMGCRFSPTCGEYAEEALTRWGLFRGGWLTVKRVARCHPGCTGGFDPVPSLSSK